ncbi:MAG: polysaccharide biosynthesis C-terminal domain-containing protein, partial [Pirellulales bacterium]|nr:polysaccharide biosynthesis C-terminal domain-containing protein [Pirellulales bacterium]
ATAQALLAFAFGLPAFVLAKVGANAFFAREDTASPMRAAVASVLVNIVLGLALFFSIGFVGLAIATSVAGWINVGLLFYWRIRSGDRPFDAPTLSRLARIAAASAVMAGAVAWLTAERQIWSPWIGGSDVAALVVVVAAGCAIYAAAAIAAGAVRPSELRMALRRA